MSAMAQQAISNFYTLNENEQSFVARLIMNMKSEREQENELQGIGYIKMVQSAIDEIANGGGTVRDLIEVSECD